jgi:hypothetical protein
MPRQLFEAHQRNLELAKCIGAIVDFNRDFERWFSVQVDQVAKELERMKKEADQTSVPAQPTAASTNVAVDHVVVDQKEVTTPVPEQKEVADGND